MTMIKAQEDTFHLGVKVLFRNPNKEILLLERKSKSNKNYWDLPGGRLQKGESLLQTLKREITEETGLNDIGNAQPFITVLTEMAEFKNIKMMEETKEFLHDTPEWWKSL